MTTVASLDVRIGAQTADLERGLRDANQQTNDFARRAGSAMVRTGAAVAGAGLAITAAAINSAITWETSFADVRKTVDGTPAQLAELEDALRSMATSEVLGSLENAHVELAGIAALAGQLGVETSSIDEFTESIAALTVASNLSGEEAATFAARFANVTGLNIETDIDNLANTIVELGNNMAATESDITTFASRLSSLSTFDFSVQDILGYSAALASLDLSPELGASNLIKTVTDMTNAVANGTPNLEAYASAAGLAVDEFTELANSDPSAALDAFVEGLSGMDIDDQLATLQELGITSSEQQRVLLTMAAGYDTVTEAVDMANAAWDDSTAAMDEAGAKAETTQGALSRLGNAFNEIGINLGSAFLPGIASIAQGLVDLTSGDHAAGLKKIGDGFGFLADGLAQIVTGDGDAAFQDTIDQWVSNFEMLGTIGERIFDNMAFSVGQGIDRFLLDLRQNFLQGISDMIAEMPGWMTNNIPGMDGFVEGVNTQLAEIGNQQFIYDQADRIASMYDIAGAQTDLTNPMAATNQILTAPNATDVVAELSPTTQDRLRQDISAQITDAVQSGDGEALTVLMDIAATLEMDSESIVAQAEAEVTDAIVNGEYTANVNVDLGAGSIDTTNLRIGIQGAVAGAVPTIAGGAAQELQFDTFHTGGTFRAPAGESEGLALLRDGEQIITPGQQQTANNQNINSGGGNNITINSYGENPRSLARMVIRATNEAGYGT